VYAFLDRLETRGLAQGLRDGTKPLTRDRVADVVSAVEQRLLSDASILSSTERRYFERLKGELWDELRNRSVSVQTHEQEPHFYSWTGAEGFFHADAVLGGRITLKSEDAPASERRAVQPNYGAAFRGRLWNVGFFSDNRIYAEWGSGTYIQNYTASRGYPRNAEKDSSRATWDVSDSYLSAGIRGLSFQMGRDNVRWGPGPDGGMMFSGLAPSMDLFKLSLAFGRTQFTWFHGELRGDVSRKWVSAHRLECTVMTGVDVGVSEAVVYGNRGMETAYWNPILPFLVSQHSLGDRDNTVMGLDADVHGIRNVRLYGELFIDDLFAPWELFSDYWGNKVAFMAGGTWANPLSFTDSGIRVEYTRVDPYVYTHRDSVNVFEHFDAGLGSPLQPNSDRWLAQCDHWFSLAWRGSLRFETVRHGLGDRRSPHREKEGEKKHFLSGTVETVHRLSVRAEWEPLRDLVLKTDFARVWSKDRELEKGRNGAWIEWQVQAAWNW
jgi:hypothetical protein